MHTAGANILILSDRGVDENHVAIPSLLAVSAVHQHLVKTKKRTSLAIILESGEPREVHHFATLLGYGACAINPYLALDTIHELIEEGMIKKDYYAAVEDYNHAVISGIVKIAARWVSPRSSRIRVPRSSRHRYLSRCHRQILHRYGQPCRRYYLGRHCKRCR